jgi:hypothetical protein
VLNTGFNVSGKTYAEPIMSFQAAVGDMAFTLKHAAGFKQALEEGLCGDLTEDLVDAVLEEAGLSGLDGGGLERSGRPDRVGRTGFATCP